MDAVYFPAVAQAVPGPDKTVFAYFTDGETTRLYLKPSIAQDGVFDRLSDDTFFVSSLTVLNDTVAWDLSGCYDLTNRIDVDPFIAYEAPAVKDPLEEAA